MIFKSDFVRNLNALPMSLISGRSEHPVKSYGQKTPNFPVFLPLKRYNFLTTATERMRPVPLDGIFQAGSNGTKLMSIGGLSRKLWTKNEFDIFKILVHFRTEIFHNVSPLRALLGIEPMTSHGLIPL